MHRSYLERILFLIDLVGGRFEPTGPFQRFRRRAFTVMLMVLALICLTQALIAWLLSKAIFIVMIMSTLFILVLASLVINRRSTHVEATASVVLSFLVVMGALLEVLGGRSPTTPLVYWSPVMLFGGYVFCGIQRGTLVAGVVVLATLFMIMMPFVMNDAHVLPLGPAASFQKRLFVTVLLCHLLPLAILGIYEKFFDLCHAEARALFDRMEGRKDRALLGRLAQVLALQMEPELRRMEAACQDLKNTQDIEAGAAQVLKPLHRLVQLTRRYEPLSNGALAAIDRGLSLGDLPDILRDVTAFQKIRLQKENDSGERFQGGPIFSVLIFLCLSLRELMENPQVVVEEVSLLLKGSAIQIVIQLQSEVNPLGLIGTSDFLNDLDARILETVSERDASIRELRIDVSLARI